MLLFTAKENHFALQVLKCFSVLFHYIFGGIDVRIIHVAATSVAPETGRGTRCVAPGPRDGTETDFPVFVSTDDFPLFAFDANGVIRDGWLFAQGETADNVCEFFAIDGAAVDFVVMARKFDLSDVDIEQGLGLIGLSKADVQEALS